MIVPMKALGALFVAGLTAASLASADNADPRVGKMSYEGSGTSEKAPEFGEVWFTFQVGCRKSADDVRQAIEAVSGNIWKTIAQKVPGSASNEVRQAFWGSIGSISEGPGSSLQTTPPNRFQGPLVPGVAKRIDVCTGKQIALNAKVPTVFSGSQRFGVRSEDLDWVEGLARKVQALPQDKVTDTVKTSTSGIRYEVTENAKRTMLSDTLAKARVEATGPQSKFASDRRTLHFTSAHYLGHRVSAPPQYQPLVGNSVSRGTAPKVTLEMPLVYTIYAEAKDLIDSTSSKTQGVRSEYEIVGKAVVDADFAETRTSVSVRCQTTKALALAATEPYSTDLLKDLRNYQGNRPASETDRIENNEVGNPQEYFPYQPVEWDTSKPNFPPTRYLNTCTNDVVDAPASGQSSDLPSYWSVDRSFSVRSKEFDNLLNLVETLQRRYQTATVRTDETRVLVSDAVADVTGTTKQRLAIAARENATAYVLNVHGPLAQDARAHGFTSAHLVDVRVGTPRAPRTDMKARAMMAPAPAGALESAELTVDIVHKSNDERPQFRMVRHYAFDFQVVTENYLPRLNPTPKPKPTEAPTVPHVL